MVEKSSLTYVVDVLACSRGLSYHVGDAGVCMTEWLLLFHIYSLSGHREGDVKQERFGWFGILGL